MKKVLLLASFCFIAMWAMAENPVSVNSGDKKVFKSKTTATVKFDFDNAKIFDDGETLTWEEYKHGKGSKADKWENTYQKTMNLFISRFNKKVKGLQLTQDEIETEYNVIFHFTKLNFGSTASNIVSSMFTFGSAKAGGATVSGIMDVIDKDENVVCSLEINNAKGLGSGGDSTRFIMLFFDLPKYIAKAVK